MYDEEQLLERVLKRARFDLEIEPVRDIAVDLGLFTRSISAPHDVIQLHRIVSQRQQLDMQQLQLGSKLGFLGVAAGVGCRNTLLKFLVHVGNASFDRSKLSMECQ